MKNSKGAEFVRFFVPIIHVLKDLGGSGTANEIIDRCVEKLRISEQEQKAILKSGVSRVRNQAQWARLYLVKAGYLESSQRGVWSLTEKGRKTSFTDDVAIHAYKHSSQLFAKEYTQGAKLTKKGTVEGESTKQVVALDHRAKLLGLLKSLPPAGFERICQRLLRESGFQQVAVTGRSGDGGIDGEGILEVNPFVTFKVMFQCKRYKGAVSPSTVRDFRGAMLGRADKGIMMTTGTFTVDAKKEARREGAPAIELVDGEKLLSMFEQLELGLFPRKAYELDDTFFDDFKK
jgi:restriction system protein